MKKLRIKTLSANVGGTFYREITGDGGDGGMWDTCRGTTQGTCSQGRSCWCSETCLVNYVALGFTSCPPDAVIRQCGCF